MVVKMEEGYDRIAAAAYAWSHTAAPMLAGTLVTAIGFMPNGFARSTAGEYTSNMFWIVGIRPDRILGRCGRVHALPGREAAAEHRDTSRAATKRSTTRRYYQRLPPDSARLSFAANGWSRPSVVGASCRRGVGHGRW